MSTRPQPVDRSTLPASEIVRQLIHIASGLWVLLLPWSGWVPLLALALAATLFNLWVLPRIGGRGLWRPRELSAGRAAGVVLYPVTVSILLVAFRHRPEVAGAGWGLLAFADGTATLIGGASGRRPLPWNDSKTWSGLVAYVVVGGLAVFGLVRWVAPDRYDALFLLAAAALTAALCALLESAPQRIDDNLTVPLLGALFLTCLLETSGRWHSLHPEELGRQLILGLGVNAALALVAYAAGALDPGGAAVGTVLGTMVFTGLEWSGFLVLVTFILAGSSATRLGWVRKSRLGTAEPRGGRRRFANAIANGGVAALCALFALATPHREMFVLAFVCSLAAATADTLESEIGSLWGHPTVLITTLQPVPPGTDGGVSLTGTLAGLAGASLIAAVAWAGGLLAARLLVPVAGLGLLATLGESVAGATLERSGLVDNHGINLLNTLCAALAGALLARTMA